MMNAIEDRRRHRQKADDARVVRDFEGFDREFQKKEQEIMRQLRVLMEVLAQSG
jgi:hypothetical protein